MALPSHAAFVVDKNWISFLERKWGLFTSWKSRVTGLISRACHVQQVPFKSAFECLDDFVFTTRWLGMALENIFLKGGWSISSEKDLVHVTEWGSCEIGLWSVVVLKVLLRSTVPLTVPEIHQRRNCGDKNLEKLQNHSNSCIQPRKMSGHVFRSIIIRTGAVTVMVTHNLSWNAGKNENGSCAGARAARKWTMLEMVVAEGSLGSIRHPHCQCFSKLREPQVFTCTPIDNNYSIAQKWMVTSQQQHTLPSETSLCPIFHWP